MTKHSRIAAYFALVIALAVGALLASRWHFGERIRVPGGVTLTIEQVTSESTPLAFDTWSEELLRKWLPARGVLGLRFAQPAMRPVPSFLGGPPQAFPRLLLGPSSRDPLSIRFVVDSEEAGWATFEHLRDLNYNLTCGDKVILAKSVQYEPANHGNKGRLVVVFGDYAPGARPLILRINDPDTKRQIALRRFRNPVPEQQKSKLIFDTNYWGAKRKTGTPTP